VVESCEGPLKSRYKVSPLVLNLHRDSGKWGRRWLDRNILIVWPHVEIPHTTVLTRRNDRWGGRDRHIQDGSSTIVGGNLMRDPVHELVDLGRRDLRSGQ
jgi:hypothetical protein